MISDNVHTQFCFSRPTCLCLGSVADIHTKQRDGRTDGRTGKTNNNAALVHTADQINSIVPIAHIPQLLDLDCTRLVSDR